MTPARSFFIAVVALVMLIGARPTAGDEQFPRGLMSAAPTTSSSRRCTIEVRPVSFGMYDTLSAADVDAVGQVIYTCGNLGASSQTPGNGNGGGGGGGGGNNAIRVELETGLAETFERSMMTGASATENLQYNLYLDATHRTIWGNGFAGTDVYVDSHPPNLTPVTVPIFGRIPGHQNVIAGEYFDTLLARVVF